MTKVPRTEFVKDLIHLTLMKKRKLNIIMYRDLDPEKNKEIIKEARKKHKELRRIEKEYLQFHDEMIGRLWQTGSISHEDYEEFMKLHKRLLNFKA